MKKETSKLIDKRFEKIVKDNAYKSIFAYKIYDLFLKYGNILLKKSIEEFNEFSGLGNKRKPIKILVWETDKVYTDRIIEMEDVWVNDEYEGFPQIITMADIETYCSKTDCPYKKVSSYLAKKGYRKYGKVKPYTYHSSRLHFFKSIADASEWIGEDIKTKTGKYIDLDVAESKISEIINTTETSKTKRYTYKGYMVKKI